MSKFHGEFFFASEARQIALRCELDSWRGTRFFPNFGKKGIGVDCVQFVALVLVNLGAITAFHLPPYSWRSGGAAMRDRLLEAVNERPELLPIWDCSHTGWPELLPGDVFAFSNGISNHHLGIYAGDNILWHILARRGVCLANVTDPTIRSLTIAIWRPIGAITPVDLNAL